MTNPFEDFPVEEREPAPEQPEGLAGASLIAQAMALQESGLLIHGMEVTDLSTGYSAQAPAHAQVPNYLEFHTPGGPDDYPYRGTRLSMARLEELLALVREVAEQRERNKIWASVNPPTPRQTFPWGLGMDQPDVLLTDGSKHAEGVQAFLRQRGFRARIVDPRPALRIHAELQRMSVEPEVEDAVVPELSPDNGTKRMMVVAGAAALLVMLAVVAIKVLPGEGTRVIATSETGVSTPPTITSSSTATPSAASTSAAPRSVPPAVTTFEEHRKASEVGLAPAAERAAIPVAIEVAGWRRVGASEGREEYMSEDPNMRILVAAKPTPLGTQEELDQAVLTAVENTGAQGTLEVTSVSPAAYKETMDGSETEWTVRLVDAHQLSIGCQVRSAPVAQEQIQQRDSACDQAIATARIDISPMREPFGG